MVKSSRFRRRAAGHFENRVKALRRAGVLALAALCIWACASCAVYVGQLAIVLPESNAAAFRPPKMSIASASLRRSPSQIAFREVGVSAGLDYRWTMQGKRPLNILQTIGNGCAFLDYDRDGCLDILLVGPKLALFRGDGRGHFTDVTKAAGLDKLAGHFLGCAVGDFDNDGFDDVYVSAYHGGVLLHNEPSGSGGRRLRDVTKQIGIAPQPWGTSCAFADVDGDGYLDLYIANYVAFDPRHDLVLCPYKGVLTGCGPRDYDPEHGVLYHNDAGTHFTDVTRKAHAAGTGKGLGVAFANFDSSGKPGFAIANDLMPGDLFRARGKCAYVNVGSQSGTALDPAGEVHAGMGIDWGDYDNDGKPDLFISTFRGEAKCLYHNEGRGQFTPIGDSSGIDGPTLPYVGWGCKFFDADNDGWLDIILANGHVQDNIGRFERTTFRQPLVFLRNVGSRPGHFTNATKISDLSKLPPIAGRGLAIGDYDNDGRVDVLVVDSDGKPLLLHNESDQERKAWIGFQLIGNGKSNRDAYGATVRVTIGTGERIRECRTDGSYLSASDARVTVGLGNEKLQTVSIRWPDGTTQELRGLEGNKYYTVREGSSPKACSTSQER